MLDTDIVWEEAEHSPYATGASPLIARDAVAEHIFRPLARDWQPITVEAQEFLAVEGGALVLARYRGARRGTARSSRPGSRTCGPSKAGG
jgi:hypothetical protein